MGGRWLPGQHGAGRRHDGGHQRRDGPSVDRSGDRGLDVRLPLTWCDPRGVTPCLSGDAAPQTALLASASCQAAPDLEDAGGGDPPAGVRAHALTKKYGRNDKSLGDWIFFGLNAAALFLIRRHDGAGTNLNPVPLLHPWSTLVFSSLKSCKALSSHCLRSVVSEPWQCNRKALRCLPGIPIFLFWRWRAARS